jgi:hypothetical protein
MTLRRSLAALGLSLLGLGATAAACSYAGDELGGGATDAGSDVRLDGTSRRDRHDAARRDDAKAPSEAGDPRLSFLGVSSTSSVDGASALTLVPAFSPDIFDYYVRCAAGSNDVTVSMTASAGAESLRLQPTPSATLPKQTFSLDLTPNQALVVAATNGDATTEYWVRCVPPDFPQLEWDAYLDAGKPTPGYYLVDNMYLLPGESGYAIVLDRNGVPVWYQRVASGNYVSDFDVLDGGGGVSFIQYPKNDLFVVSQLSPEQTSFVRPDGVRLGEHEVRILPNGDYLGLASPTRPGFDLTGLRLNLNDGGKMEMGPDASIQDCQIVEFAPDGHVIWSWFASDHFDIVTDSVFPWPAPLVSGALVADVFHCNSIDLDPANGNLLVSARDMDSVFYIDMTSKKVLWKMGGKPSTKDNAAYVPVPDAFHRQHDARLRPGWTETCSGGSGRVSMFDDESGLPTGARAVVYDVVVGPPDGGADCGVATDAGPTKDAGPPGATVYWQFTTTVNSNGMGSFRIYPDGSYLIGWGNRTAGVRVTFTELDVNGHSMIDFLLDPVLGNTSYRAVKVPLSGFDLNELRSTAGVTVVAPPSPTGDK